MSSKKVYVGNIPYDLSESDLEDLFATYGKVGEVAIPTDKDTGRVRGFAFVTMDVEAEADAAIEGLNGKEVGGRTLVINEARAKGAGPAPRREPSASANTQGRKLYVTNLAFTLTEGELTDEFGQYGTVESAKIITDRETGKSRGFAFVTMKTTEEASAATSGLNGADIAGRPLTVREAENKPRSDRHY